MPECLLVLNISCVVVNQREEMVDGWADKEIGGMDSSKILRLGLHTESTFKYLPSFSLKVLGTFKNSFLLNLKVCVFYIFINHTLKWYSNDFQAF